jgi:hypothetical protein
VTISVVQSGTFPAAWSGTMGSPVTSGNTLFLVPQGYENSGGTMSTSAPLLGGNPVTGAVKLLDTEGSDFIKTYAGIWMLPNCPGGSAAVAITMSGSNAISNVGLFYYEVAGLGSAPVLDQSSSGNSGSGSGTAVSSGTTGAITSAPEFILGAGGNDQGAGSGAAGFTSLNMSGLGNAWAGYQIASSSGGTFSWSQTAAAAARWAAAVVAISAAPSAPRSGLLMACFP